MRLKYIKYLFVSIFSLFFATLINAQNNAGITDLQSGLIKNRSLFSDNLYSKPSGKTNLKKINTVQDSVIRETLSQMLQGKYSYEYRIQEYQSYPNPEQLALKLKTSPYSQFENPTGIFFTKGEQVALIVDDSGDDIQLQIVNFGKEGGESVYKLTSGINMISPENSGNGYIRYFTNAEAKKHNVKIHIIGGLINGYFDINKNNNQDWKMLLSKAPGEILDIMGNRVQLAYSVESLKKYCPDDGVLLTTLYDSIISIQHSLMGLNKYHRVPDNHIFGRVIWDGFMHADELGAAFHDNTMEYIADVRKIPAHLWGIAHEFGHVDQVHPWMTWVGTTEVTNNIYSVWTQYLFNPDNPKLEREVLKDYDDRIAGGRITSYMESAFIHHQEWLTQAGPDRWDRHRPRDWGGDHFVKLVPLWQLQLYYAVAGEGNPWYQPDFYADIFIRAIDRNDKPANDAAAQLNFIKTACDVTKTDLTDFFTQSGMLLPIDKWVDDYTCAQMTITENDIADVKQYASQYKKQETPVMHYITANSIDCYRNRLPVTGQYNEGIALKDKHMIIDHDIWKNAVAFETYKNDSLVKIAFAGAGSGDNKSTLVRYPDGATRIEAVAWNGKRSLVYGQKNPEKAFIQNPILPGFNPDPCITRAGNDYYIVTSTFEWFPGLPVYHSKDLVNWEQTGHVLTRKSQLDLTGISDVHGVYAPAITYHKGTFYVVYTVVQEGLNWTLNGYPNYIVIAKNPKGPWSEPVLINSLGFDPSLFIDDDGKGYLVVRIFDHRPGKGGSPGIGMHEVDMKTLKPIGDPKFIYNGWAKRSAEGPHLLKKDGYYYLFTAEGGTGYGHYEAVARSKNIWGPYDERAPEIFYTTRDDSTSVIQKAGHGMLVETPSGEWYTTHLGSRPLTTYGNCCLGRETFIQPVAWTKEGWPQLDTPDKKPQMEVKAPECKPYPFKDKPDTDHFNTDVIDVKYQFLREPYDRSWLRTDRKKGFLSLKGRRALGTLYGQSMIAQRITSYNQTAETCLEFNPASFKHAAGLACYYNSRNFYFLNFTFDETLGKCIQIWGSDREKGYQEFSEKIPVGNISRVYLRMQIKNYDLQCYYSIDNKSWQPIGNALDFGKISDDYAGGYTGAMISLFAQDMMYENQWADFDYFSLSDIP